MITPPSDTRTHEYLELENGLRCVLIVPEEKGQASCSLTIGVGALSDPDDCLGLGHFLEHMLFWGSEKYPRANELSQFISQNGGYSNATTSLSSTSYVFEVDPSVLSEALDRFGACFTCPVISESAVSRELLSLDSEFQLTKQSDSVRLEHLACSLIPSHKLNRFSWGNSSSLGVNNLHLRALEMFQQLYSSNLMTLCVYAPSTSISDLQNWVRQSFSGIKNLRLSPLYTDLGLPKLPHTVCCVSPVKDTRNLDLHWMLPPLWEFYESRPDCYIIGLLGHESKGGIQYTLKNQGLATDVVAGNGIEHTGSWFGLSLSIKLTRKGFEKIEEVLSIVFSYIEMIRNSEVSMDYYSNLKTVNDLKFRFFEKLEPAEYTSKIAEAMQRFPLEKVLTAGVYDTIETTRPGDVNWLLNSISYNSALLILRSESFESECTQVEPWFGIKYLTKNPNFPISLDVPGLSYPETNNFLPERFVELAETGEPEKLYSSKLIEAWHNVDGSFSGSRANAFAALMVPEFRTTIERSVTADLIAEILKNDINNEFGYHASEAGYIVEIHALDNAIEISVSGFSDKITTVLEHIMEHLYNYKPTENSLSVNMEKLAFRYKNENLDPRAHSRNSRLLFLQHQQYDSAAKLETLMRIVNRDLEFSLGRIKLIMYITGNILQQNVTDLCDYMEGLFHAAEVKRLKYLAPRTVTLLPEGATEWKLNCLNSETLNSVLEVYFQFGQASVEERTRVALLEQILDEDTFDELRNNQQLGYYVSVSSRITRGIVGLLLKICSADYNPDTLAERAIPFVRDKVTNIKDFKTHVKAVISKKKEPFCNLTDKAECFWDEILQGYYEFKRKENEVKFLKALKVSDFNAWLTEHSFPEKRLDVKVFASKWGPVNDAFSAVILEDVEAFHNQYACYSWLRIMH